MCAQHSQPFGGFDVKLYFRNFRCSRASFKSSVFINTSNTHSKLAFCCWRVAKTTSRGHILGQFRFSDAMEASTGFRRMSTSTKHLISFSRPHTMFGTLISITSMGFMACLTQPCLPSTFIIMLLQAILSALPMNIAIVGLNQLYDKKMDKINKPYLPLAAGSFSTNTGLNIVALASSLALIIGALCSSFHLMFTLVLSLLLGVIYSVDSSWMRWKQVPILALSCILCVRALLVQWGFHGHFAEGFTGVLSLRIPRNIIFSMCFMGLYSIVIALLKDTPDVVGDLKSNIRTFSVRFGVKPVLRACMSLLCVDYLCGIYLGITSMKVYQFMILTFGHLSCLLLTMDKYAKTVTTSSASLYSFYMFVWKMFYLEYLILPFL